MQCVMSMSCMHDDSNRHRWRALARQQRGLLMLLLMKTC